MNSLVKIPCLFFMLFSFGISQEYYYYGHCAYDTMFVKKDGKYTMLGSCCTEECTKETRNRAELEVYRDDPYIRTKDCKPIIREINSVTPIFAEYCLQEYYDNKEKRKIPDKWDLRLVEILDTITKIYPYEYEEIRECIWDESNFCSIDIPNKYDSLENTWTIFGPALTCDRENGYLLYPEMKNKINKVKEYNSFFKEKFYISIPYSNYWPKIDRKELESYKNIDGSLTIEWNIRVRCPPKENNSKHFFSGSYNIRIIGECPKEIVNEEK